MNDKHIVLLIAWAKRLEQMCDITKTPTGYHATDKIDRETPWVGWPVSNEEIEDFKQLLQIHKEDFNNE